MVKGGRNPVWGGKTGGSWELTGPHQNGELQVQWRPCLPRAVGAGEMAPQSNELTALAACSWDS